MNIDQSNPRGLFYCDSRGVIGVILSTIVALAVSWPLLAQTAYPGSGTSTLLLQVNTMPDSFRTWNFDTDDQGNVPTGFSADTVGGGPSGQWKIVADPEAPSVPHVLTQSAPCAASACFQLLLADGLTYEYLDLTVGLKFNSSSARGAAGIVFGVRDKQNFYAALVDPATDTLELIRVADEHETVLGRAHVKRGKRPWHRLRIQYNTIISKEYIQTSFDGKLAVSVQVETLVSGKIGLVTQGQPVSEFDSLHVAPLYSSRPLSPPAAY